MTRSEPQTETSRRNGRPMLMMLAAQTAIFLNHALERKLAYRHPERENRDMKPWGILCMEVCMEEILQHFEHPTILWAWGVLKGARLPHPVGTIAEALNLTGIGCVCPQIEEQIY